MDRRASLAARRTGQTLRDFRNGPALLRDLARGGTRVADLTFVTRDGLSVTCPNLPGARVPIYEVFAEDAYRFDELVAGLGPTPIVLDIGAHVGCFSLGLAHRVPGARIVAYEASPATAAYTSRNVEANGLGGRIEVKHCAVSDRAGTLVFADHTAGSSLNGLTAPSGARTTEVPAVSMADAFASAPGPVGLVKIDTEGAEYAMVLASDPADWASVRSVVLEYHDVPDHGWPELADFFARAGLIPTRVETVGPRQGTVWLARA